MRPVLHGDLVAAALHLAVRPKGERDAALARLLVAAELADRYRKRLGRPHPRHGNGSLMAAARLTPGAAEPRLDDPAYLDALGRVIAALADRTARRPSRAGPCNFADPALST